MSIFVSLRLLVATHEVPVGEVDGEPNEENYDNCHDGHDELELYARTVSVALTIMTASTLALLGLSSRYRAYFISAQERLAVAWYRAIV